MIIKKIDGIGEMLLKEICGIPETGITPSPKAFNKIWHTMGEIKAEIILVRINFPRCILPLVIAAICRIIHTPPKEKIPAIKGI